MLINNMFICQTSPPRSTKTHPCDRFGAFWRAKGGKGVGCWCHWQRTGLSWPVFGLGALGSLTRQQRQSNHAGRHLAVFPLSSAELLVDGDRHGMDEVCQAIRHLETDGRHVRTTYFAPPERAHNKKWRKFFSEMNINFQPVPRSKDPSCEANDNAITKALLRASRLDLECVGLITADSDFIDTMLEVQRSGTTCLVFVPTKQTAIGRSFEAAGVHTVRLKANCEHNVGPKVRAFLHENGTGSVQLASPFQNNLSQEMYNARTKCVTDFLARLGYGGTGYTIQSIAKFWYANKLGSLVVFPSLMSLEAMHEVVGEEPGLSNWTHYAEFGKLAFVLPVRQAHRGKSKAQTYGNSLSHQIFKGGGPFMLSDSPQMVAQVLQVLGYLDDKLNADLPEAMLCFVNAARNKQRLKKRGMLPAQGERPSDVESRLRQVFLSSAFDGQWQVSKNDAAFQILEGALRKARVLENMGSRCSRQEMFEAMKTFAEVKGLPRMKTFNGLAWRVWQALIVSGSDPLSTGTVEF